MAPLPLVTVSLLLIAAYVLRRAVERRRHNPRQLPLPPGPKGVPIIGNLLQIPNSNAWEEYHKLSQQYGDMIYLEAFGQGLVVLGSLKRAKDMLEHQAVNFSNRPYTPIWDLMFMDWSFILMQYGNKWRQHRRAFHQHLNNNAVPQYHPIMKQETGAFLRKLRTDPEAFLDHIKLLFGTSIMRAAYGFDDLETNLPLIYNAETIVDTTSEAVLPGRFLVNYFHWMKYIPEWFPGAGFQTHFKTCRDRNKKAVSHPFNSVKENLSKGVRSIYPSMATSLIDRLNDVPESELTDYETICKNVCAIAYVAGADTTVVTATILVHLLANHPNVQERAQAEIDSFIGRGRLPSVDDRGALPYVHAIVKEVGRWHSVLPIGAPHASSEDCEYEGYFIPKGTTIFYNTWAIMHNPDTFEKPFEFIPERYLKDGKIDPTVPDPEISSFGFGRRICPGRYFSSDGLFLMVASLLTVYSIRPPKDDAGNTVKVPLELSEDSLLLKPRPFKCEFQLRSPEVEDLLRDP